MFRYLLSVLCLTVFVAPMPASAWPEMDDDSGVVSDFSLTDRGGKVVTRDDLLGKVWIASFVLVRCPDAKCPQVTQTVKRLQDELSNRRDLVFVTFTCDPDHDDPAELSRYADAFGADPERWLFLTGSADTIDRLLKSFHFPTGAGSKKSIHSQKLVLVDREGHIRGYFDGMKDPPPAEEVDFENNLRRLKRKVDQRLAPDLPAWMPRDFPAFNATLNALSAALILLGYWAIRNRLVRLHITCMVTALAVSAVFLTAYLFYHLVVKEGRPTRFSEQAPGAPPWMQYLYLGILGTHTILAVFAAPLALFTAYQGWRDRLARHVAIAKWTLPIWLYVSVTGVVVYWMLYRLYPSP